MTQWRGTSPLYLLACLILAMGQAGCSSSTKPEPVSLAAKVNQDNRLGPELSRRFEPNLQVSRDAVVDRYLNQVAQQMLGGIKGFENSTVEVRMVKNQTSFWRSYALPGIRVYISAEVLKRTEYENEAAAAIAFELAHILNRHLVARIRGIEAHLVEDDDEGNRVPAIEQLFPMPSSGRKKDLKFFTEPGGAFDYGEIQLQESIERAVEILYGGQYDPRGLVALWRIYEKHPKHSPYSPDRLRGMIDQTYSSIVEFTPLRNPIVRTNEFLTIKKRIQRQ